MCKTVIITGGTKGIGDDISRMFYQEGWSVVIASRKPSDLVNELRAIKRLLIGCVEGNSNPYLTQARLIAVLIFHFFCIFSNKT